MLRDALPCLVVVVFLAFLGAAPGSSGENYEREITTWRRQREVDLKADDGWLTVSGLFWLRPGEARIGSDPSNDVLLPPHAPESVGTITVSDGRARFRAAPGVAITRNGAAFESGELRPDADADPDILAIGDVKLILLKRGSRLALRLKDNRSPLRTSFAGLRWFPVNESWRITAEFVAFPEPKRLVMDTVIGETEVLESPGYVTFERDGKSYRLQAARLKDGRFWFVFRDGTSGKTTYGGARQLYADPPRDGRVSLDFNKAYNLPCSYNPYSTCPLAPPQNRLGLPIDAGELKYEPQVADRRIK
jgi:uncharacterized protein (DUF1684 family)